MPWNVKKDDRCPASKPWAVVNADNGRVVACHISKDSARQQQKALYANVPESDRALRADADDNPDALVAALDATLDSAMNILAGVDRESLAPELAQLYDLVVGADTQVDKLMELMGVSDPDDDDDDDETAMLGAALGLEYIVSFDYRADGGPMLIGTFPSREAARDHVLTLEPIDAEWCVVPITPPGVYS